MTTARDPVATRRAHLIVGDHVLSVPVPQEATDAINAVASTTYDQLVDVLAPFGLHPYDLLIPEFRRVVYRDELAEPSAGGPE